MFHVGGVPDSETSRSRWEFFIGDRPHCAGAAADSHATERQPIEQIGAIEHFLDPGEVAISSEAAEQARPLPVLAAKLETGRLHSCVLP